LTRLPSEMGGPSSGKAYRGEMEGKSWKKTKRGEVLITKAKGNHFEYKKQREGDLIDVDCCAGGGKVKNVNRYAPRGIC